MTKKQIALLAVNALKAEYPDAVCSLDYSDPLQCLVATRLSAQCTDARVNLVTPALFERFTCAADFAASSPEEVADYIRTCGLYKTKSRDIVAMARVLCDQYGGEVPSSLDALISLPGIGRKTANLVMGDIFGMPGAVVVDTHCIRITRRLGLHTETDQKKIELLLRGLLPAEESSDFCHRLVLHGRAVCTARSANCEACCMADFCRKKLGNARKKT